MTFYLYYLIEVNVVLGYEWLECFGKIELDLRDHVLWVMVEGKKMNNSGDKQGYSFQGLESSIYSKDSSKSFRY